MRYQELEEYQTKNKQEIDIKYIVDSEGNKNRGWTVHKLEAFVDGKEVGYLKISYIPKERFKAHYPHIINYLGKIAGQGEFDRIKNDEDLFRALQLRRYIPLYPDEDSSNKELIKQGLKEVKNRYGKAFRQFKNFHVDKPLVDYIRVASGSPNSLSAPATESWRRQGIATALYYEGAKWLWKNYGFYLWASGVQSAEAKAAWQKMMKDGHVVKVGKRYHIDPTTL